MGIDLRQTDAWAKHLESQGWKIEKLKAGKVEVKVYIRKIPIIGSVIKIQRPKEIPPIEKIDKIARKYRALFVKLEPLTEHNYNLATKNGFEFDPSPNLPTKTIVIDLAKSEKELWKNLSKDTRQSIRKANKNQLTISTYQIGDTGFDQALDRFTQLLVGTGQRQRFWTPSFIQLKTKAEAFGKDAVLFLVYSKTHTLIAGALILMHDGTHSASSKEGQQLYASYFLHWEMIRYLQKHKKVIHQDLSGIYDPRFHKATRRWQGFTVFKRKFGGREVEYPKPLIKYYNPLLRLLFKFSRI